MMWGNHGGWDAGDWLAMSLMMIVFWGLVIALVVWAVRSTHSDRSGTDRPTGECATRADELLAERFARGEIDEDEFTNRRDVLHRADRS
jgi:putative membrane protein